MSDLISKSSRQGSISSKNFNSVNIESSEDINNKENPSGSRKKLNSYESNEYLTLNKNEPKLDNEKSYHNDKRNLNSRNNQKNQNINIFVYQSSSKIFNKNENNKSEEEKDINSLPSPISNSIDKIKEKISKFNENLKKMQDILNDIIEKIKMCNLDEIQKKKILIDEIIKNVDSLLDEISIEDKINKLNSIINKLSKDKKDENNDVLKILLKISEQKNQEKIRIFGDKFIENNSNCEIKIENNKESYKSLLNDQRKKEDVKNEDYNSNHNQTLGVIYKRFSNTQLDTSKDNNNSKDTLIKKDIKSIGWKNITKMKIINLQEKNLNENIIISLKGLNNKCDLSYMFCDCSDFLFIKIDNNMLDTEIINICNMFRNCYKLKHINFGKMNTSSINDMSFLFAQCKE